VDIGSVAMRAGAIYSYKDQEWQFTDSDLSTFALRIAEFIAAPEPAAHAGEPAPAIDLMQGSYELVIRTYVEAFGPPSELAGNEIILHICGLIRNAAATAPAAQAASGLITSAMVQKALSAAWNDFVSDTGCYPSCFEVQPGKRIKAEFERAEGAFLDYIADTLNAARLQKSGEAGVGPATLNATQPGDKRLIDLLTQAFGTRHQAIDDLAALILRANAKARILTAAAPDVLAERHRQISAEGWTPEHDDEHDDGDMAIAAAWYAVGSLIRSSLDDKGLGFWPWSEFWFKPTDRRRDLVKASALLLAEIERIDRAAMSAPNTAASGEGEW